MIVSITHEDDLDGLGSQAIIKRYFDLFPQKEELILLDAHYSNFIKVVEEQLSSKVLPLKLIISDIGFNKSFESLFKAFKIAKQRNCSILWFDHHIIDDVVKEKINQLINVYINDTQKCATEIIKDYFLPNDPIAKKIAKYARDTDFKTKKSKTASNIQLIIGYYIRKDGFKSRRKIVELLAEGRFKDPWFDHQLKELANWIKIESKYALQKVKRITINNFGEVCISYAKIGGGKITQMLKNKYPNSKAYVGIDLRYNEIIIYSDHVNCREFARYFGGGGHEERAGFKHSQTFSEDKQLSENFIHDITITLPKFSK
jgi:oligoribonuclease NrnB/cAMP/cGMP phosphodiesterase (DHH superfamily)